jgi:hypothetical protein
MDLPLSGGVSRWSNNLSWPRLGPFLVSPKWEIELSGSGAKEASSHVLRPRAYSLG